MAREARLWHWMRDGLKGVPRLHMLRVENMVSSGDPDVEGCYGGHYFEVELKGCDRPVRGGRLHFEVRMSQVIYHRRRQRCGGNTWLYVRVGEGARYSRYLIPGVLVASINWDQVTEQSLALLAVLPPQHTPMELLAEIKLRKVYPIK